MCEGRGNSAAISFPVYAENVAKDGVIQVILSDDSNFLTVESRNKNASELQ